MKNTTTELLIANSFVVVVFCCQPVLAQESAEDSDEQRGIEEIVVTASKRGGATLLDTPMSIQAISGEDMEARDITQFIDYARTISGMTFEEQGPGDKKIIIRGLQSTGAATTGLYFDDMVITGENRQDGGGRQPDIRLVDMERIEVLKGPQGTLYGASSMSGTIRMITNKPDPSTIAGAANANFSSTEDATGDNYDLDVMLNVPLIEDKLAIRLVGHVFDQAGFNDDLIVGETGVLGGEGVNTQEITGGRAALRWLATDDVTLDLMLVQQDTSTDGPAWYQPLYGEFIQRNHTPAPWNESLDAWNLSLNWEMSHGIVTATASEIERDLFYRWPATRVLCTLLLGDQDICWAPEHPLQYDYHSSVDQPRDRSVFSSEVRYASLWDGPFQMIGGIFYQKEESEFSSQVIEVDSFGASSPLPEDSYVNYWITNETEQLAVFGELTYDFTDSLSATVGARGFSFDINEVSQNRVTRFRPVAAPLAFSSSSEDDVTWRFNLSYDMGDYLLYTTYAEGFRSGGNNEPDFTTGTVLPPYQSDSVQSYELGAKGSLFGGQLQLDVAAYYMDWQDIHARVDAEIEGSEFIILGNAGAATIQGIELGAVASKPFDNADFTFGGNLALINAELSEDDPFGRTGLDGDRIPNIPEVTFNLFADWDFSVFTGWNTSARIDYLYVGKSYSHFRPDSPIYNDQGDYSLVNLRLTFDNDRYRLGFFVDNVLDEDGVLSWISDFNFRRPDEIYPMRPRTYGIDVGYRF